jgi:WD40 repeat protein
VAASDTRFAVGTPGGDLLLGDIGGPPDVPFRAHAGPLRAAAFTRMKTELVTAGDDGRVLVWAGLPFGRRPVDWRPGEFRPRELARLGCGVEGLTVSPLGDLLAVAGTDGAVRLLAFPGGEVRAVLPTGSPVRAVAFRPAVGVGCPPALAAAGDDGVVRLWELSASPALPDGSAILSEAKVCEGHGGGVFHVAVSSDGATAATASADGTVRLWRVSDGKPGAVLNLPGKSIAWIGFSPDSTTMMAVAADGTVAVFRVSDGAAVRAFRCDRPAGSVIAAAGVSPDGRTLAVADAEEPRPNDRRFVRLFSLADGRRLREFPVSRAATAVAFSPDGATLGVGEDPGFGLWGTDGSPKGSDPAEGRRIDRVFFTAAGVPISSADTELRVYDPLTGREIRSFPANWAASVSGDGRRWACALHGGAVAVRDLATGRCLAVLVGHRDNVWTTAFTPDGRTLITAGEDRSVRLWDLSALRGSPAPADGPNPMPKR